MYWNVLTCVVATCFLWIILAVVIIWKLDLRFENSETCQTFGLLAETTLPIIGNAGFIPITSILLDVFLCTKSVGSNYDESYMDRDCFVWCWEGDHIKYVVLSSLCLVFYVPFSIFTKPWWQIYQHSLSIITSPRFLMLKSVA
jgi:hypothetical protein